MGTQDMVRFIVAYDAHQPPVRPIDTQYVSIGKVGPSKGTGRP